MTRNESDEPDWRKRGLIVSAGMLAGVALAVFGMWLCWWFIDGLFRGMA